MIRFASVCLWPDMPGAFVAHLGFDPPGLFAVAPWPRQVGFLAADVWHVLIRTISVALGLWNFRVSFVSSKLCTHGKSLVDLWNVLA